MKRLALLLAIGCLAGCSSPAPGRAPAPAATPTHATLRSELDESERDYMGGEIRCQMQSIDGDTVGLAPELTPGRHTLIANLTLANQELVGVVRLLIPAARDYRIRAREREGAITVTLEEADGHILASSTAAVAPHMVFTVFVVQK